MVGALADWFAVTALFKHPLGIPIPHTAIIKRKKDQLGEGLGTFVRENFMSPEVVETKLRDAQIAGRMGKWLSEQVARRTGGRRGVDGAARAGRDAAGRGRPAGAGPDDRQAHRRTAVGATDRAGAELAARGGPTGGADPAAGRPRVPMVAERRRDHRTGDRARLADVVAAVGRPPDRRADPPRAHGLHRQGAAQPRPRTAPLGHQVPVRVRRRSAARRGDRRPGREGQGTDHGARRGRARRPRRPGPRPSASSSSPSTTRRRRCAAGSPTR